MTDDVRHHYHTSPAGLPWVVMQLAVSYNRYIENRYIEQVTVTLIVLPGKGHGALAHVKRHVQSLSAVDVVVSHAARTMLALPYS